MSADRVAGVDCCVADCFWVETCVGCDLKDGGDGVGDVFRRCWGVADTPTRLGARRGTPSTQRPGDDYRSTGTGVVIRETYDAWLQTIQIGPA